MKEDVIGKSFLLRKRRKNEVKERLKNESSFPPEQGNITIQKDKKNGSSYADTYGINTRQKVKSSDRELATYGEMACKLTT